MFRRTAVVATFVAAVLALSACAPGATSPTASASAGPVDKDATLTVGLVLEPTNLDIRHTSGAALEQILIDNIYQGLVRRTQDNEIEDSLATKHEISADGLTYTFTLAEGITFQDGTPLTAEDVVTSYTQVKDDATMVGHGDFADVASVVATDANTITITLSQPNQNFLFSLTGPAGLVFKKGDATDLKTAANGTGPFKLASWKKGDSITFDRNDDYWGKEKAGVKEIVFSYIPDFTAGVNAALAHEVDVLTAVDPNLASQFDSTDFTVTHGKTTDKGTLAFNNAKAPLSDVRVRQALRMAIDHKALVEAVGAGETLFGPIPQLDPGYEDLSEVAPYDPAKAKELLAQAGQSNLKLTLTIPNFYGTTVPQVLVSDFNKIGVTLKVNAVEFSTWLTDVYTNKNYDLSFVLHVEPRDFGNFANPDYYFNYDNAEVQKLYAEAERTVDPEKSADILKKAARIVSEDAAADWLYVGETLTAVSPQVHGFPQDSINSRIDLAGVTVTD
ncbi:ABC transporter substrate-binding protein [Microbacterium gorillae]|uniref:ABC transporter substrate-binding protein n=1 Tax=Microbacterium gorillae TaxID=1231063 RepID=UPI00058D75D9|nr:ABC transporter substrate-binding protein [Microbacterium gorillae]